MRYMPDGKLDSSFGTNGFLAPDIASTIPFVSVYFQIYKIVVQPDGKILTLTRLGTPLPTVNGGFAISRFNPDGSFDTSFNGTGSVTRYGSNPVNSPSIFGLDFALDASGRITAAGSKTWYNADPKAKS
jgi:uncharacterized delta-60 repeat protein